jgi:amidase
LKPSRDRIAWRHSGRQREDVEFVVARSLRDTAGLLDLLRPAGDRARHPTPYSEALARPPRPLRIGFCTRSPVDQPVTGECIEAVESTVARLEDLGHRVEDAAPETFLEYEERSLHGAVLGFLEYRECLRDLETRIGRRVDPEDVEPFLWELAHVDFGARTAADIERSTRWLAGWENRTRVWFESFDLLVTPTVCEPAPDLDELDPRRHAPLELLGKMVPHMAFTEIWNATGQPAISLPLDRRREDGLPIGVQLVAPPGRDDRLIALAACLLPTQTSLPRVPPIHA